MFACTMYVGTVRLHKVYIKWRDVQTKNVVNNVDICPISRPPWRTRPKGSQHSPIGQQPSQSRHLLWLGSILQAVPESHRNTLEGLSLPDDVIKTRNCLPQEIHVFRWGIGQLVNTQQESGGFPGCIESQG